MTNIRQKNMRRIRGKKQLNDKDKRAISDLLSKIDRIISGRTRLEVKDGSDELGRGVKGTQSANKLLFDYQNIERELGELGLSTHLYLILKGLNFHELSHYLYTDLNREQLETKVKNEEENYDVNKFLLIVNELEDVRIENMFSEKYNKAKDYFKYLSLGLKYDFLWIDAYGRKRILPPNLLRKIKIKKLQTYDEDDLNTLSELIDKYITTLDTDKQYELAKKIYNLMFENNEELPRKGNTDLNSLKKKKRYQEGKRAKEGIMNKVENGNKRLKNEDLDVDKEEISEEGLEQEELEEAIKNAKEDLQQETKKKLSNKVEGEIEEAKRKSKGYGVGQSNLKGGHKTKLRPTPRCKRVKNDLVKKLKKIRIAFSPYYKRKRKKGRIDIREALKFLRTGTTKIFREYKRDKRDETNLALLLALDNSGSMAGHRGKVARRTCWIMNEALKDINADLSAYMWSSEYHKKNVKVLKSFSSDFDYVFPKAGGGTKPTKAMELAIDSFSHYNSISDKEMVFILFTDGQFKKEHTEEPLKKMRKMNIHNLGIALRHSGSFQGDDVGIAHFDNQKVISSIEDLPEVVSSYLINVEKKVKANLDR